jgi:type I restriction enzyme S subunit
MKAGWQQSKIGDYCEVIAGQSPEGKHYNSDGQGMPFYQGKKDFGDRLIEAPSVWTTETTKVARNNDILMSVRAPVGPVNLATEDICIGRGLAAIRCNELLEVDFLFYQLLHLQPEISGREGAVFASINKSEIAALPIAVGPLPEQQRIVTLLDEAFDGLATAKANAEKNLENARAIFESHLQSVFTERKPGVIAKRLDEIATFSSGGTPTKSNDDYWIGDIPWISGRDMKSTRLHDSVLHISQSAINSSATRLAPVGTLLVLVRGMGLAHGAQIGELKVPCAFNQDIKGIHPKPGMVSRYLLFALRYRINSSGSVMSNAAHGTLKIDSGELMKVMIPLHSEGNQKKIVETVDALAVEVENLESIYQQKLTALEELKKSLLHRAFNGDL